jgi:hypothetical protein
MLASDLIGVSMRARLAELERESAVLRKALDALDGKAPSKPNVGLSEEQAEEARVKREPLAPRWIEVVPAGKLIAVLKGFDGISASKLAKVTNGDPEQVNTLLREMEQAGQVRRSGRGRGVRWFAEAA